MSNTKAKAEKEFEILEKVSTEDNKVIVLEFKEEILALVDKFGNSGQSGGSAPYVAQMISSTVKKLCMQEPIAPLTGEDDEWFYHDELGSGNTYQNNRESAVFKETKDGRAYYLDAIIFQGEDVYDSFTGSVEGVNSRQYIKSFPFESKKFYVDVYREPLPEDWNEEPFYENKTYDQKEFGETGVKNWKVEKYRYHIKNKKQALDDVFEYYDIYTWEVK